MHDLHRRQHKRSGPVNQTRDTRYQSTNAIDRSACDRSTMHTKKKLKITYIFKFIIQPRFATATVGKGEGGRAEEGEMRKR